LAAGLPEYIETFKHRFRQMKQALEMAKSEHEKSYVKGQMNELYKLIEMHVQSLRNIQNSMRKYAASQETPVGAGAGRPEAPMDDAQKGELASFLKNIKVSETDMMTLRQRGWDQITAGDWDGALATLTKSVELVPDDLRILVLLGWAYAGKEMYEKAEGINELVLEKEPDHPMALANLGYISLKRCNYREAIEFLSRVVRQDTDKTAVIYANYYMGLVYFERQMFSDAVAFFEKSIELAPNLIEAYYHLGLTYRRLDRPDQAQKVWEEAIRRNPQNRWSELARSELESSGVSSAEGKDSQDVGFSP
jgi:tetratricopeptide (TPR) repeat protein